MTKAPENSLVIYTDGACSGNPGPGGWGAVLIYNGKLKQISGFAADTTNNRMELQAVIEALKSVKRSVAITIYTDSKYVQQGITTWIKKWRVNGWNKGKVKNIDLWQQLDELNNSFDISWQWVKGHAGNKYNEQADTLATAAIVKGK